MFVSSAVSLHVPMAMGGGEVAVFVETNLRTHLVLAVSADISAADFKRKLEGAHFSCFPKSGEIKVQNLMVNRKSCFYHLPDSFPIKYSFQGLKGTRFLLAEVRTSTSGDLDKPVRNGTTLTKMEGFQSTKGLGTLPATVSDLKETKKMTKKEKNFSQLSPGSSVKECSNNNEETPDNVLKGTGNKPEKLLKAKHSTDYTVTRSYPSTQFAVMTPARIFHRITRTDHGLKRSADKLEKTAAVGKRIVKAAAKLRISRNNSRPGISLYRVRTAYGSSIIRTSIFEISDDED